MNIRGWFFVSCYFIMETSSAHVISSSLWVKTLLFDEIPKLDIETFWYLVHIIYEIRKLQRKQTNYYVYESFVTRVLQIKVT